jgi:hypothetical protein
MRAIGQNAADRCSRLVMAAILGLTLGACSKCDVPFWRHDAPAVPASCHDGPSRAD